MTRRIAIALLLMTSLELPRATATAMQPSSQRVPSVAGPSLEQTRDWLQRNVQKLGVAEVVLSTAGAAPITETIKVESVRLAECQISMRIRRQHADLDYGTLSYTIPLKDLDFNRTRVREMVVLSGQTLNKPRFELVLTAARDRPPFVKEAGGTRADVTSVSVPFGDESAGYQAYFPLHHAAMLCGASDTTSLVSAVPEGRYESMFNRNWIDLKPDGVVAVYNASNSKNYDGTYTVQHDTVAMKLKGFGVSMAPMYLISGNRLLVSGKWETYGKRVPEPQVATTATPSAARQATPAAAASATGMTNADVVKMVDAGLSETVVSTAISQERAVAFDLTTTGLIALKKAKVPDVVIAAMQARVGAPKATAAAPVTDVAPRPKYDPNLAAPTQPAANGCDGIEMMGAINSEPVPYVIMTVAKIRNTTNITRVVGIQWLDMYGQTQKAQVEVGAGQIASAQINMGKKGERPPQMVQLWRCR